jgi:hypothetical protein
MQLDTMVTLEDYARLPRQSERRLELSRGLLVRRPHPSAVHAIVAARTFGALRAHAATAGGHAVFDTSFLLQEEPPTIRRPDTAFLGPLQATASQPGSVLLGAPQLAVEIIAATTNGPRAELIEKVFEFLDAGARGVWVVDLGLHRVVAYEAGAVPRIYRRADRLDGAAALPGFGCAVASLFA